jgi:site-specific recombinase XerD
LQAGSFCSFSKSGRLRQAAAAKDSSKEEKHLPEAERGARFSLCPYFHHFANGLLNAGMRLERLQVLLGHSSLQMT